MSPTRSSLLALACFAFVAAPAAALVLPAHHGTSGIAQTVARKGTRNFVPDGTDTGIAPAPPATTTQAEPTTTPAVKAADDALQQCMETWDAGTHITKSNWKAICKRQLRERDADATPSKVAGKKKP
jgi:hypothetical protein